MLIEETIIETKDGPQKASALCVADELFSIRCTGIRTEYIEDGIDEYPGFTLTHKPTGYAMLTAVRWDECLETLRQLRLRTDINWAFTDPVVAKSLGQKWLEIRGAAQRVIAAR